MVSDYASSRANKRTSEQAFSQASGTRKHKKSWSLPAPALWKEKQGGEVDKVDKVIELEGGVDAKCGW
jgi:hypothetical protein